MSASTRTIIVTTIACLLFGLIIQWSNGRELAKIQSMGAELYVSGKQQSLRMPFPATVFTMLVFIALYEGVKKLTTVTLRRLFPDANPPPASNPAARAVRVSDRDWNSTRVTIVDESPPPR